MSQIQFCKDFCYISCPIYFLMFSVFYSSKQSNKGRNQRQTTAFTVQYIMIHVLWFSFCTVQVFVTLILLLGSFVVLNIMWGKNTFGIAGMTDFLLQMRQQGLTKHGLSCWIFDVDCLIIIMAGTASVVYQQHKMFTCLVFNLIGGSISSQNNGLV